MSTTYKANIGLTFADGSTKTIGMDGVLEEQIPNISTRAKAINANMSDAFKRTFTNENNSPVVKIGKLQSVATEEEVIYSVN